MTDPARMELIEAERLSLLRAAVHNNVRWCDAICRAHQVPGEFREHIWMNRNQVPPLYPNADTLTENGTDEQMSAVEELIRVGIHGTWAVKDSFAKLDLRPLGFRMLFETQWIVRPASLPLPEMQTAGTSWARMQNETDMEKWERGWKSNPGNRVAGQPRPMFPESLIGDDFAFFGGWRGNEIIAGCAANRSDGVVGISNMFLPSGDAGAFAAGCVTMVARAFPRLPIVGYAEPDASAALGFLALAPVRIWMRIAA